MSESFAARFEWLPVSPDVMFFGGTVSTSVTESGRELIAAWTALDRGMAEWILKLADFDESEAWRADGYSTCAAWLATQCQMSRSDAFDKLKVSRELRQRAEVREAFSAGMPYSKVRLLVRLQGLDAERDAEYVADAWRDSIRVLEARVERWNDHANQDRRPPSLDDRYGIRRTRGFGGGLGRVVIEAPDDMLDRMFALFDAYGEYLFNNGGEPTVLRMPEDVAESTKETADLGYSGEADPFAASTDESDESESRIWTGEPRSLSAKRLDWMFDLFEEVALSSPDKLDPYVAAVGVTIQYEDLIAGTGEGVTSQGSPLRGEAVRRLCCDAGVHRIVVRGESEILDLGRDQRLFNRKQRRAIQFRHAHVCAIRGCGRRVTQVHHIQWWENDGETNIDNGVPLCSYHHHLVHEGGWNVAWNPLAGITRIEGPLGQVLETETRFTRMAA